MQQIDLEEWLEIDALTYWLNRMVRERRLVVVELEIDDEKAQSAWPQAVEKVVHEDVWCSSEKRSELEPDAWRHSALKK